MSYHPSGKVNKITIILLVIFAVIAMLAGMYSSVQRSKQLDISELNAAVLESPRPVSDFALVDNQHQPFTQENLKGRWSMVFFGFTNCPHICPTSMYELSMMYQALEDSQIADLPQVILVSVDPGRDDVDTMNTYVSAFHPNFIGLTGDKEQIDRLAQQLGIAYIKMAPEGDNPMHYNVEHSGAIMLINPKGELAAFFSMPHDARILAQEYPVITG